VTHTILLASADCSYLYPREASAAPAASFSSAIRKLLLTEQFLNWFAAAFEEVGRIGNVKSASVADRWSCYRWLQANLIVHRVPQTLFAPKVTLRRLNAHMTE
jgi:hypothetical protein